MRRFGPWLGLFGALGFLGCGVEGPTPGEEELPVRVEWALALHGGAGVMERSRLEPRADEYRQALAAALRRGADLLAEGTDSLDVVEEVVRMLEEDDRFNAGRGAVFTHERTHELDAAIMRGADLATGAVAGVRTVRNPITLARKVMEETPHVLLAGDGAEAFADSVGVDRVENAWFDTPHRLEALEEAQASESGDPSTDEDRSTVGAVARDRAGNLAAATSTGGTTNKRFGRIGDVPIVGAGTYADNATCAVSGTGRGEEFIRHGVARAVADRLRLQNLGLSEAVDEVIHGVLSPGDGGVVALQANGTIVMDFNSQGMFRGAADSSGRFEVGIWPEDLD